MPQTTATSIYLAELAHDGFGLSLNTIPLGIGEAIDPNGPLPMPKAKWLRTVDQILLDAGRSNLWFSGFGALPFDIPVAAREPSSRSRTPCPRTIGRGWRHAAGLRRARPSPAGAPRSGRG